MEALAELILMLLIGVVALYGLGFVAVALGAAGWYLSYPILGIITVAAAAFPIAHYRALVRRNAHRYYWKHSFWNEEAPAVVLIGIALTIIWCCALRTQIADLWTVVAPYVLR